MCGRYSLYESMDLETRYGLKEKSIMAEDNFNIAPGQNMSGNNNPNLILDY